MNSIARKLSFSKWLVFAGVIMVAFGLFFAQGVFAQSQADCQDQYDNAYFIFSKGCAADDQACKDKADEDAAEELSTKCKELLGFKPTEVDTPAPDGAAPAGGAKAKKYGLSQTAKTGGLPNLDKDIPTLIGQLIAGALGLVAIIFFALMIYGGFLWMTAAGNTERANQAKTLITNALIGLVVIALAYAITNFVINLLG